MRAVPLAAAGARLLVVKERFAAVCRRDGLNIAYGNIYVNSSGDNCEYGNKKPAQWRALNIAGQRLYAADFSSF